MNKTLQGTTLLFFSQVLALESTELPSSLAHPDSDPEGLMKIKHEYFKFVAEFGKQLATKE